MRMISMILTAILSVLFIVPAALAQSSSELTCRSQAKEIALQTYQTCITTARQQRIDEIRKEYQAKLTDLKSHYDSELKKVSGAKVESKNSIKQTPVKAERRARGEKGSPGVVRALPQKQNKNEALSMQTIPEGTKAVSSDEDSAAYSIPTSEDGDVSVVEPGSGSENE